MWVVSLNGWPLPGVVLMMRPRSTLSVSRVVWVTSVESQPGRRFSSWVIAWSGVSPARFGMGLPFGPLLTSTCTSEPLAALVPAGGWVPITMLAGTVALGWLTIF